MPEEWIDVGEPDIDRTASFLSGISMAEESRLAKVLAHRNAGRPFDWHRCPAWQEDESSPGNGIPWRNPHPGGFRYFSITEIEVILMRGHY